jgi:diacylglycerol kinase family enzyme
MKRLMIVYNPRSSQFGRVNDEVLAESRRLKGWVVGKFEVVDTNVDDNAAKLAKLLNNDDLVVAAGGDGTATIALNGIMSSKAKDVKLGVLGYGNFNDMARTLDVKGLRELLGIVDERIDGKVVDAWALECLVDGKHWRWGMGYFTIGLFAEACAVFDQKDARRELRTGRRGMFYSVWLLKRWYMKHRKCCVLGDFRMKRNGKEVKFEGMTDYVAVNGMSMAKVMRGGKWFLGADKFLSETRNLRGLWSLFRLMWKSVFRQVPGEETQGDVLTFDKTTEVMIQAEGEYRKFEAKTVEVRKATKPIKVVMKG